MKPVIYVAGKYSGDVKQNIEEAEIVSIQLLHKGWAVLTPHKNTAGYEKYAEFVPKFTHDFWMENCLSLLSKCDAIFMMRDWEESKGATTEHEYAVSKKIPIYYQTVDKFPDVKYIDNETWDLR